MSWLRSSHGSAALIVTTAALSASCGPRPATRAMATMPSASASTTGGSSSSLARAPAPPTPVRLTFIQDHNFAHGTTFGGRPFGGISALAFDATRQRMIALSDAHKSHAPARMYELDVNLDEHHLAVRITRMTTLGGAFAGGLLDPEGLAPGPASSWVISTEGDGQRHPRLAPALYRVAGDGSVTSEHALPDRWTPTPTGELTRGVSHNKGIEGLTASPSGNAFYAISETPLAQDGAAASFDGGGRLRLMHLNQALEVVAEYHYLTEAVARLADTHIERVLNGVSALTAVADGRILVLERAAVKANGTYHNRIQIFEVDLRGASDVRAVPRLSAAVPHLRKRRVLDLDAVVPRFEQGHRSLDNFEGMALGPLLPSGAHSLLLVSDDNFKRSQRTAVLAFAMRAPL